MSDRDVSTEQNTTGWVRIPWRPGEPQPRLSEGKYRGIRATEDGGLEGLPVEPQTTETDRERDHKEWIERLMREMHLSDGTRRKVMRDLGLEPPRQPEPEQMALPVSQETENG